MNKQFCKFCGEQLDKSDIFCKECGAKVEKDEEIKDAVIDGEKNKQSSTFIISVIVILLLVIVIAGAFLILK